MDLPFEGKDKETAKSQRDFYNWLRKLPVEVLHDLYRRYTKFEKGPHLLFAGRNSKSLEETLHDIENDRPPPDKKAQVIILRRSIFFLIGTFIVIEFAFDFLFLLLRFFPLYVHTPAVIQNLISPWYIMLFLMFNILKLLFMLFAAISWVVTRYELREGEIRFRYGILFTEEKIYIIKYAQEVVCDQSLFGRIFNYGTIQIYNPVLKETVYLDSVPDPHKYVEIIKEDMPNPTDAQLVPL